MKRQGVDSKVEIRPPAQLFFLLYSLGLPVDCPDERVGLRRKLRVAQQVLLLWHHLRRHARLVVTDRGRTVGE